MDEVKRPFLPFPPILPILHCRGAKPAAAKPAAPKTAASKADYSRPRQTMANQSILISAVITAFPMPLCFIKNILAVTPRSKYKQNIYMLSQRQSKFGGEMRERKNWKQHRFSDGTIHHCTALKHKSKVRIFT